MNNKYVLLSTDNSDLYKGFWELNSLFVKRINLIPVLFLITDNSSDFYTTEHGIVKNVKQIDGVPSAFQSQIARLWGTQFFNSEVCMTSDIDMLLLKETYFKDSVKDIEDDCYVNLSANFPYRENKLSICYNVATGDIFKKVLNIPETFPAFIYDLLKMFGKCSWDIDEYYIAHYAKKYPKFVGLSRNFNKLGFTDLRIDRSDWKWDVNLVDQYIDAHCIRPICKHKNEIKDLCKVYNINYE